MTETSQGPDQPEREGFVSEEAQEGEGPQVHTSPAEGHPAGEGERSDRDIGGPTSPEEAPDEDPTGGAHGTRAAPFEPGDVEETGSEG